MFIYKDLEKLTYVETKIRGGEIVYLLGPSPLFLLVFALVRSLIAQHVEAFSFLHRHSRSLERKRLVISFFFYFSPSL